MRSSTPCIFCFSIAITKHFSCTQLLCLDSYHTTIIHKNGHEKKMSTEFGFRKVQFIVVASSILSVAIFRNSLIIQNNFLLVASSSFSSHHAIILDENEDSSIRGLSQRSDDPQKHVRTDSSTSPLPALPEHIVVQDAHLHWNQNANVASPLYLPEALQPAELTNYSILQSTPFHKINFEHFCCPMAGDESNIKPNRLCWQGICHTPRACSDLIYPFSGEGEKEYFRVRDDLSRDINSKRLLRSRCDARNRLLTPPYKWCRQWLKKEGGQLHSDPMTKGGDETNAPVDGKLGLNLTHLEQYNHRDIDPYEARLPPPGCSHLSHGGGSGSYHHVILFPRAKLGAFRIFSWIYSAKCIAKIQRLLSRLDSDSRHCSAFCGIPKVGITQWIQFLRFTFGAKDYQASPYSKPDQRLFRFDMMREEVQKEILNGM